MNHKKKKTKNKILKLVCLLIFVIGTAVFLEAAILYTVNNKNVYQISKVLLDQAVDIIEKNQKNEDDMIQSLKEDYIVRAKAVSYIIDAKPEAEKNITELKKIADLMSIDEIHIFDKKGKIYSGTEPKYYGYSFDSGEQMAYFKPMLKNKKLTMCQDVTPNTSEGKKMMYALVWNEAGDRMIQVGIEPVRLLQEVKQNEADAVVANMPVYKGMSLYVTDKKSGKIYGATDSKKIGKTLDDIGLSRQRKKIAKENLVSGIVRVDGEKSLYIIKKTKKYIVGVTFEIASDNASNMIAILIMVVYLSIAAGVILLVISRLSKVRKEKKEQSAMLSSISEMSNIDKMTGCFNRRSYEEDLSKMSANDQFIYISMDVNGLKIINDSHGHAAGDELICGAAACMRSCFDKYGKVYRIGGDEFVAVLFVQLEQFLWIKTEFDGDIRYWTGNQVEEISISCGYVSSGERKWASMKEIANVADIRMYEEKAMYYKKNGVDRQGQPASYVALYRLYSQILRINLQKDHYKILNWKETIHKNKQLPKGTLTEWFDNFQDIQFIHPDDREEYQQKTDLEYLKQQFAEQKEFVTITYRVKEGTDYKTVTLEIVPEDENSKNTYEGFLYVKDSKANLI
ncbi:Probable diguanylate cyclase YdaM [uncultured Eubacterium sp.]|nr:Probable diguanylate cyclase YdaM [uncultured Eubacterium sp.]